MPNSETRSVFVHQTLRGWCQKQHCRQWGCGARCGHRVDRQALIHCDITTRISRGHAHRPAQSAHHRHPSHVANGQLIAPPDSPDQQRNRSCCTRQMDQAVITMRRSFSVACVELIKVNIRHICLMSSRAIHATPDHFLLKTGAGSTSKSAHFLNRLDAQNTQASCNHNARRAHEGNFCGRCCDIALLDEAQRQIIVAPVPK